MLKNVLLKNVKNVYYKKDDYKKIRKNDIFILKPKLIFQY